MKEKNEKPVLVFIFKIFKCSGFLSLFTQACFQVLMEEWNEEIKNKGLFRCNTL